MAKLVVNPTSSSRREILIPRSLLSIGRDPSNDLVLPDAMVSRRHAVIECRGNHFLLRDCNSSNGSLVNGDRVTEHTLKDGDLVAIGTARLLFRGDIEDAGAKVVHHPSSPRFQCSSCNADYRMGDQFCRQCGATVAQNLTPTAACPSCGTVVNLPARYCNLCGAELPRDEGSTRSRPIPEGEPEGSSSRSEGVATVRPSEPEQPMALAPPPVSLPLTPPPQASNLAVASEEPEPRIEAPRPAPVVHRPASRTAPPGGGHAVPRVSRSDPSWKLERRHDHHRFSVYADPGMAGPRVVAAVMDAGIVMLGLALFLAPVGYYWNPWLSRDVGEIREVQFIPVLLSVVLFMLAVLLGAFYYIYFWGVRGATPGKQLMGLVVQDLEGRVPIGASRALVRFFGYLLSATAFGVGVVMAVIFTGNGVLLVRLFGYLLSAVMFGVGFLMLILGLHDRLAGTRVARREAF